MFLINWPHKVCHRSFVFIWIETCLTVSSINVYIFKIKVNWNLVNACHFNLPHWMHHYVQNYSLKSLACWQNESYFSIWKISQKLIPKGQTNFNHIIFFRKWTIFCFKCLFLQWYNIHIYDALQVRVHCRWLPLIWIIQKVYVWTIK